MNQKSDDIRFVLDSLPWSAIFELSKVEHFGQSYDSIPDETLMFVLDEANKQTLINSALKSLSVSEPENANVEYATKLAEIMMSFALGVLAKRKARKS